MPVARVAGILVALVSLVATAHAAPKTVTAAATLGIIQPTVDRITAAGQRSRATDGMDLAVGDRVVTGRSGVALITFLDGSTVTVHAGSDVVVRQADVSRPDSSTINVFVNGGTVWARVARLVSPGSKLSLQSNTATASVHDGLIGAHSGPGEFHCWTQAGEVTITAPDGQALGTLAPGQMAELKRGALTKAPFAVHSATLRVEAPANVLPLVQMPYDAIVAGFVAPGIEVNQVYGSATLVHADGRRTVEVPAGVPGPYTIVLEAVADGPFEIIVLGLYRGGPNYRLVFRGRAAKGERLWTSVAQDIQDTGGLGSGPPPDTARPRSAQAASFKRMAGDLKERIWLSPREIEAAPR